MAGDAAQDHLQISVVVPLLDEEPTLRELHARLGEVLTKVAPEDYEIVFVDDGSRDGSADILSSIAREDDRTVVVELRRNFGKSAALAAGFAESRGDVILTLDADLQDVPEELPQLLARLDEGADVVSGRKRMRRDPWVRRAASWIFNRAVSFATGIRVRDVNSGAKAIRREVLKDVPMHGDLHRYLPVLASSRGYRIAEVDVTHQPRAFGSSRYGWYRYVAGLLDTVTILLLTRYETRPLHLFGIAGGGLTLGGLGILAYLSLGWLFGEWIGNRPLFTLGVLMVITGIQFVFFGLLAELVVMKGEGQPAYAVRRIVRGGRVRSADRRARGPSAEAADWEIDGGAR